MFYRAQRSGPLLLVYKKQNGVSVCLSVSILLLNYWTDLDQNWHGPPPGPWKCPSHTFWGAYPPGGEVILKKLRIWKTFPYCYEKNNFIIQIQI